MTKIGELYVEIVANVDNAIKNIQKFQNAMSETAKALKGLQQLDKGFSKISKTVSEVSKATQKSANQQKSVNKVYEDSIKNISDYEKGLNNIQKYLNKISKTKPFKLSENIGVNLTSEFINEAIEKNNQYKKGIQDIITNLKKEAEIIKKVNGINSQASRQYDRLTNDLRESIEQIRNQTVEIDNLSKKAKENQNIFKYYANTMKDWIGELVGNVKSGTKYILGFLTKWKFGWFGVMAASVTSMYGLMKASSILRMWFAELTGIMQVFSDTALAPLSPTIEGVLAKLWGFQSWFEKSPEWLRKATGWVLLLGGGFGTLGTALWSLGKITGKNILGRIVKSLKELGKIKLPKKIFGEDFIERIGIKGIGKSIVKAFGEVTIGIDLGLWINSLLEKAGLFKGIANLGLRFRKAFPNLTKILMVFAGPIGAIFQSILNSAKLISSAFGVIINVIIDLLRLDFGSAVDRLKRFFEYTKYILIQNAKLLGSAFWDSFKTVISIPIDIGRALWNAIIKGLKGIDLRNLIIFTLSPFSIGVEIGTLIANAIINGLEGLGSYLWNGLKSELHEAVSNFINWAKGLIGLSPTLTEIGAMIPQAIMKGLKGLGSYLWNGIKGEFHNVTNEFINWVNGLKNIDISGGIKKALDFTKGKSLNIYDTLKRTFWDNGVKRILYWIRKKSKDTFNVLKMIFWDEGIWNLIDWVRDKADDIYDTLKTTVWDNGIKRAWDWIKEKVHEIYDTIKEKVQEAIDKIKSVKASDIYDWLKEHIWDNGIKKAWDWIVEQGHSIYDNIKEKVQGVIDKIKSVKLSDIYDWLKEHIWDNGIKKAWDTIVEKASGIYDSIKTAIWDNGIKKVIDWIVKQADTIYNDLKKFVWDDTFKKAWDYVNEKTNNIPNDIVNAITTGFSGKGSEIWEGIKSEFHYVSEQAEAWAKGILGLSPTLSEIGAMIPQTISESAGSKSIDIHKTIKTVVPTASDLSTGTYTTVGSTKKVVNINFNPTINIKTDFTSSTRSESDIRSLADKLSEYWKDDIARIVRGST